MNEDVGKLLEVVSPPEGERRSIDWPTVFAALGAELPRDFRELAEACGGGQFDDHLYLLEPSGDSGYDVVGMQEERTQALAEVWAAGEPKPPHLTEDSRLIVWTTTDDGQSVYRLVKPEVSPEDWTVLVEEGRGPQWEHFLMGCAAFRVGTLTAKVRSKLLSSDYPTDPHTFVPMSSFNRRAVQAALKAPTARRVAARRLACGAGQSSAVLLGIPAHRGVAAGGRPEDDRRRR